MINLYDLPLDWVDVYKSLIDEIFAQYPESEAVEKVKKEVLPQAQRSLDPLKYERVKEYANEIFRELRQATIDD
jgi:hypothetical protein